MHRRTLKEILADHNLKPLTTSEREVIKWKHLRASTAYPRYFIHRYGRWIYLVTVIAIISGVLFLIGAGLSTLASAQIASVLALAGIGSLTAAVTFFLVTTIINEYCDERPAYFNQRLDHRDDQNRKCIPEDILQHIDRLTHNMGSGVEVSIEGDSTQFSDSILVHYTCWVRVNNPLQIEVIASWEILYENSEY